MFGQSINGSLELSLEILLVLQHLENLPVILLDHHANSVRVQLLDQREESFPQQRLLTLRRFSRQACLDAFHLERSHGFLQALLHLLNLSLEVVDLALELARGRNGRDGKGRLFDLESVDLALKL